MISAKKTNESEQRFLAESSGCKVVPKDAPYSGDYPFLIDQQYPASYLEWFEDLYITQRDLNMSIESKEFTGKSLDTIIDDLTWQINELLLATKTEDEPKQRLHYATISELRYWEMLKEKHTRKKLLSSTDFGHQSAKALLAQQASVIKLIKDKLDRQINIDL